MLKNAENAYGNWKNVNLIQESEIIKISIPSVNEKSRQHIKHDPLTQNDYTIETEKGNKFQISITNRF